MADSLNSSIQKLGDTISSNLFGNKSNNPVGSTNFSGIYMGPGGGIDRANSVLIGNTKSDQKRYGSSFKPIGYFRDKSNEWIDNSLKSLWKTLGNSESDPFYPGVIKKEFRLVKDDNGKEIDYFTIYGAQFDSQNSKSMLGFTPPGYHLPTGIWKDGRLSRLISDFNSLSRTYVFGRINSEKTPMSSPLVRVDADSNPGFTPIKYFYNEDSKYFSVFYGNTTSPSNIVSNTEAQDYMKKDGKGGFYKSKSEADYSFKFGIEEYKISNPFNIVQEGLSKGQIELSAVGLKPSETPKDNEDPLYTGFEIIINNLTSPLFNGEALNFINKFNSTSEINSRKSIINDFIFEASKFFKFSSESDLTFLNANSEIFNTPRSKKRHYIKKVNGINKLIESNTPSQQSSFVKYRNDLITLSFYEDTTLELGTLMSLYKSLYWSRINGKNIIPENLLRFDCRIIVSEVRNFTRIKKASGGVEMLQTLKENVSRYVYDLYECQLFFDKMSHGDAVTMEAMNSPDSSEISMSWKYSTMAFERYDYDANRYKHIDNKQINPTEDTPSNSNSAQITADGFEFTPSLPLEELYNGYGGKDKDSSLLENYYQPILTDTASFDELTTLNNNDKEKQYNRSLPSSSSKAVISPLQSGVSSEIGELEEEASKKKSLDIYGIGGENDPLKKVKSIIPSEELEEKKSSKSFNTNFKKAGELLLNNVKKAALNEAQRQLNNQFRLVNNSLDKIRSSFGIGRMREPTNVYSNLPNAQFFFDVKNSLRDFGGDVLGGLLGG